MLGIINWRRESRSLTLAYQNTEAGYRAILYRPSESYWYKWRGVIPVDG